MTELTRDEILTHIQQWAMTNPSGHIPTRCLENARKIREIEPGIDSSTMQHCIKNLPILTKGGILVLSGKYGCGKTFAAICTIPLYIVSKGKYRELNSSPDQGREHFYSGMHGFVTSHEILKAAFRDDPDEYCKADKLLIVDDLGWEHFTDKGFGISEWDRFFDSRYRDMLPTIITTNLTPAEFKEKYTRRIYDRLRECAIWFQSTEESLRKGNGNAS